MYGNGVSTGMKGTMRTIRCFSRETMARSAYFAALTAAVASTWGSALTPFRLNDAISDADRHKLIMFGGT